MTVLNICACLFLEFASTKARVADFLWTLEAKPFHVHAVRDTVVTKDISASPAVVLAIE